MGVNFLIMWAEIDPITRAVITETRVSTLASWCCSDAEMRVSTLAPWCCSDAETRVSTLASWCCSDVETRVSTLRLCAAVMAMISPASGVWTLLSDDLIPVIFG